MRVTLPRRASTAGMLAVLLITGSACQTSEESTSTPKNEIRSSPTSQTTVPPQTSTTETTAPPPTTIPEGFYVSDGFALRPPEGWKTIDRQSIVDGSIAEGVPERLAGAVTQEVTKVFDSGALVAFYLFDDPSQYTPNITVSRLDPQPEADTSEQAANTVKELQEQGFTNVSTTVGSSTSGTVVGVRYRAPAARTGFIRDLFASSYVVFGTTGMWTVTGLNSTDTESIDQTVSSLANSLLET